MYYQKTPYRFVRIEHSVRFQKPYVVVSLIFASLLVLLLLLAVTRLLEQTCQRAVCRHADEVECIETAR